MFFANSHVFEPVINNYLFGDELLLYCGECSI